MTKKRPPRLLLILSVLAFAFILFAIIGKSKGWIGKKAVVEVTVEKITRSEILERVSASGKIQPEIEIKISPDVSGEITHLYIKEGDSVKKGQLLLKIKPDKLRSILDQAFAALNNSQASLAQSEARLEGVKVQLSKLDSEYKRNLKLYQQKTISDAEFEQVEMNYKTTKQNVEAEKQNVEALRYAVKSAQARVQEAEENLALTQIFSPETGIISKLNVERGERVVGTSQMAGTELLRIANLKAMEVKVNVNENDIIKVKIGDTVSIEVDAYVYLKKKFKGMVTSIASTATNFQSSGQSTLSSDQVTEFEVKIRILSESYTDLLTKTKIPFRPGMTASVDIITAVKKNSLIAPLSAVVNKPSTPSSELGEDVVFVYQKGKAVKKRVQTGISDYDHIEILSGLVEGEEVISGPFLVLSKKLNGGEDVKVKKNDKIYSE